ncbi:hypothetical protein [Robiginitalea marina]|uniref:Uncharacterized protein n=1 Tax=Robiginitalea marina TaxID=2954105 RepID=A0ABT1AZL2_9FLAO|nr:hypothetical protein [Robiginitalea marina]
MKNFALAILALWMTLRPLWPLAEYVMNYEYIATVLCENREVPEMQCNGKCYLSKMLAREQAQDPENPFESPLAKTDHSPIIAVEIPGYSFPGQESGSDPSRLFWGESQLHTFLFVFEVVQPPEGQYRTPGPLAIG